MYVRNRSKKRKYLIVKLFGTRSCDRSLYVCSCRYNGCINRWDVHITASSSRSTSSGALPPPSSLPPPEAPHHRAPPWSVASDVHDPNPAANIGPVDGRCYPPIRP